METTLFTLLLPFTLPILFILINKLFSQTKTRPSYNLPPGPWKLPVVGSLHHLVGYAPHRRLLSLAKKHGPLFHLKLGEVDLVVITSPSLAAEAMRTHDLIFASRPQFLGSKIVLYNSGDMVFSPYGKLWAQLRKICMIELLGPKRVKHFRSVMEEEGDVIVEKIRNSGGTPVNLSELLLSSSNAIISRATFGRGCAHERKIFAAVKDTFRHMSGFDVADLFPSVGFLGGVNGMRRRLEKAHEVLDGTLNRVFEEHREKGVGDEDLVDVLLRLKESGELDSSVTMDNLKGVITDLILGGTETTSSTMEWAISEIIRHPEVMQKVQLELRNTFKGKTKIHEHDITNLPYLHMVVKESLRLRPPAPVLVPRHCRETVELGGYTIPAGARLLINAWAIMRDPKYWHDAERFNPERVVDNEQDFNVGRFQYMPFGGGRRVCPGVTFGMANIEIVLANLFYHFDWKLPGGKRPEELDMEETFGLALTRKNPLFLVATPHKYYDTDA